MPVFTHLEMDDEASGERRGVGRPRQGLLPIQRRGGSFPLARVDSISY